ncbi:MAG: LIM domain-containing protein, partial [Promethearchaeota archaeon]
CRFCQKQVKETHYCEECGSSFCSECLQEERKDFFTCQECNAITMEPENIDGKKVCKECHSEKLLKISRVEKSCPKCHSMKIINLFEKKDSLEQKFLELITRSRELLPPLREVLEKWTLVKQKIKEARAPPIKCYHFPNMETELISLYQAFSRLKNDVVEKLRIHFHHLSVNEEFFFNIYAQPNSNIKIIEGILENLSRSFHSIQEYMETTIPPIIEGINSHEKKLQFIEKIKKYFSAYKRFLSLAENEKAVYAIPAKLVNGNNNGQDIFNKKRGMLFITNYDLSFIHEYGIIKKKQELIIKVPVNDINRIREKGLFFKKLYLEFSYGTYEFALPPKSVSRVIEYILLARAFDETVLRNLESVKKLDSITISLNNLSHFIENAINTFYNRKCKFNEKINNSAHGYNKDLIKKNSFFNKKAGFGNERISHRDRYFTCNDYQNNFESIPGEEALKSEFASENQKQDPWMWDSDFYVPPAWKWTRNKEFARKKDLINKLKRNQENMSPYSRSNEFYREDFINPDINAQEFRDYNVKNNPENIFQEREKCGPFYQDLRKNHLSEYFTPEYSPKEASSTFVRKFNRSSMEHVKKLHELRKKEYALRETLKELSNKFDQGSLSKQDYFKTYRSLQEEIFSLEDEIITVKEAIERNRRINFRTNYSEGMQF